jgi:secreted PhoX family phosphatase
MSVDLTRRRFLKFMGRTAVLSGALKVLPNCAHIYGQSDRRSKSPFSPLLPTTEDKLSLASGFRYDIVLRWRQKLNAAGDLFGFNNDYIAYIPLDKDHPFDGLLWVNHESHDPFLNSGWAPGKPRTQEQVNLERREVGGSIVHVRKVQGRWQMVPNSRYNRRLDAFTPIPFACERAIEGKISAIGTLANCAGGVTPWGSILSCEENYQNFVGEVSYADGRRLVTMVDEYLSWSNHVALPPEHYGWVVEVNPKTGEAKKLTALGRFCHECATTVVAQDGRCVVYSGDDTEQEHIYKFIGAKPGSLEKGSLYVADTVNGKWLLLDREKDPRLKMAFKDQTELLIRTREAAKIIGATPQDRPEDIEIDPITKHVFIALTNGLKKKNHFGSILKLVEKGNDPLSLEFKASTFMPGGADFACPDNMVFDPRGNLWMCTDISGKALYKEPYGRFGSNGLFYIPLSGPFAGAAYQVASAPAGAEFTGPCFAPDYKSLFLSVQHPGEGGDPTRIISHWPDGGLAVPAPCVVEISGPTLNRLINPPTTTNPPTT